MVRTRLPPATTPGRREPPLRLFSRLLHRKPKRPRYDLVPGSSSCCYQALVLKLRYLRGTARAQCAGGFLGLWEGLRAIIIVGCGLTCLYGLQQTKQLEILDVSCNKISGLELLRQVPSKHLGVFGWHVYSATGDCDRLFLSEASCNA